MIRKQHSSRSIVVLSVFVFLLVLTVPVSAEWHEKVLYSFQGGNDGQTPAGGVVFDKAGNLYGATVDGGADNCSPMAACGTVFQLQPPAKKGDAWTETVLYVFKGKASNDGENPDGGLVMDAAGNLYGTAAYGGTGDCVLLGIKGGCGTVYEMSPPAQKGGAWTETTIYSFKGGNDGYVPQENLVFDSAGNLYGVTLFGGGKGTTCDPYYQYCGTVFKLSPPKQKGAEWTEKVLYSFAGGTDGANPNGGLVLDNKGAIYGTTYAGGTQNCKYNGSLGCGTAFGLKPRPANRGCLERENASSLRPDDIRRWKSHGWLAPSSKREPLWHDSERRAGRRGYRFRISPPSGKSGRWKEAILYGLSKDGKGLNPESSLLFDSKGNLYGTANDSGEAYYGTSLS